MIPYSCESIVLDRLKRQLAGWQDLGAWYANPEEQDLQRLHLMKRRSLLYRFSSAARRRQRALKLLRYQVQHHLFQ